MGAIHRMHAHLIACGTRMTHSEMAPEPIALAWIRRLPVFYAPFTG